MDERWTAGKLKRLLADVDDEAAVYLSFDEAPGGTGYPLVDAATSSFQGAVPPGRAPDFVFLSCNGPDPHDGEPDVTGMTSGEIDALFRREP